jgi:hypothetical protein
MDLRWKMTKRSLSHARFVMPSFKPDPLNQMSLSVLGPSKADGVIDATIAKYRELRVRFR